VARLAYHAALDQLLQQRRRVNRHQTRHGHSAVSHHDFLTRADAFDPVSQLSPQCTHRYIHHQSVRPNQVHLYTKIHDHSFRPRPLTRLFASVIDYGNAFGSALTADDIRGLLT
jgi:hypothetical protein